MSDLKVGQAAGESLKRLETVTGKKVVSEKATKHSKTATQRHCCNKQLNKQLNKPNNILWFLDALKWLMSDDTEPLFHT